MEKPLSLEKLKKIERDRSKPGICYLSYIPATLRPYRLKQILSSFGEITKVFLKPEDPEERKRRRRENNVTEVRHEKSWFSKETTKYSSSPPILKPNKSRVPLVRIDTNQKGKRFTEGWVEFARKSDAKKAALVLNGQPMGETGAGKGSRYPIAYMPLNPRNKSTLDGYSSYRVPEKAIKAVLRIVDDQVSLQVQMERLD